jgi:hypothetical protein
MKIHRYIDVKIEYKYVVNESILSEENSNPLWEPGPNRIITEYILENK